MPDRYFFSTAPRNVDERPMSNEERVATNLRTLLILEAVAQADAPLSPTEINREIGLPKQSIHRLCQTLVDEGFLIRDVRGKKLQPAPRTLKIAQGLFASRQINIARHQILMNVSAATKETVNFVVPELDGDDLSRPRGNRLDFSH